MRVRYAQPDCDFYRALRKRVNAHFRENEISTLAGWRMKFKTLTQVALFVGSYGAIVSNRFDGFALFGWQVLFLFTMFLMTIGIAHDAAHNSYTKSRKWNRRIMYLFDFFGINSHHWIQNHVFSHHGAPNVPILDSAIESFGIIRLHPKTPLSRWSRYQHIYMFGVYSFVTIFQAYFLEFISFRQKVVGFEKIDGDTRWRLLQMIALKLGVLTYSLLIPIWANDASAWILVAGFFVGHMLNGIALGVIFQTTHLCDYASFPEPDENGVIQNSFARHILATTTDFSVNNPVATWISGGLNIHVAHHLFPAISQIHLPVLAKIVRETAQEFGIPYREYTLWEALVSHIRTLKKLGRAPHWEPGMPYDPNAWDRLEPIPLRFEEVTQ